MALKCLRMELLVVFHTLVYNAPDLHYLRPSTSSNSFISNLLTGGYVLNCIRLPLKFCIQVAGNTTPIYYTSINTLGLCALPTLNY